MLKTIRDDCNYSPSPQGGVSLIVFERVCWRVFLLRSGSSRLIAVPIWRNLGKQSFTYRWTSVLYLYTSWYSEFTPDWTCDPTNSEQQNLTSGTFVFVSNIAYIIRRMNGSDQKDLCIPSFLQERRRAFFRNEKKPWKSLHRACTVRTRYFIIRQDWIRDSDQECSTVQ